MFISPRHDHPTESIELGQASLRRACDLDAVTPRLLGCVKCAISRFHQALRSTAMLRKRADTAYGSCHLTVDGATGVADRLARYAAAQAFADGQSACGVEAMQDDSKLFASHARK